MSTLLTEGDRSLRNRHSAGSIAPSSPHLRIGRLTAFAAALLWACATPSFALGIDDYDADSQRQHNDGDTSAHDEPEPDQRGADSEPEDTGTDQTDGGGHTHTGEPEHPDEPEHPGEPEDPEPDEPEHPGEPEDPEPDEPEPPGEPEDPEPDEPEPPGEPEDPEHPDEPERPGEPEDPEYPDEPEHPDEPEDPEHPDEPGEPDPDDEPADKLADLELDKTVNDLTPLIGGRVVFTITLTNRGPDDALGIDVIDALETGFAYVSDDGNGSYDPATGRWRIDTLRANDSLTLSITADVNAAGSYRNAAEVTHSLVPDPDSVPGDGQGDDFDALIVVPRDPGPDTDGDGVPDSDDLDDDNDGIPDVDENDGATDQDGDGTPDSLDTDSDNDGIPDTVEAGAADDDGDGEIDGFVDDNGNGLDDGVEANPLPRPDSDGDGHSDELDIDADGDGLTDATEAGPRPNVPVDSDGDSRPDYLDVDADNDGIVDNEEGQAENGYVPPAAVDSDDDGLDDAYDADTSSTDPGASAGIAPVNTDGAADPPDYLDLDTDDDTVPDTTEGHDANLDGQPDQVAGGNDADHDGLDDAFDLIDGPVATPDSSVAPRQDADGDGTRDWRDADDDNDDIPTVDEDPNGNDDPTDDDSDNDGTPDYLDPDDNTDPGPNPGAANGALSGTAWLDADADDLLDGGETRLTGWIIEILGAGAVLDNRVADANGDFSFADLPTGEYTLQVRHPDTRVVFGRRVAIDIAEDQILLGQDLPVDASGVVYDALSRVPIAGAVVTLVDALGAALPDICLRDRQQGQRVASDGFYRLDVVLDADAACRSGAIFTLHVDAPAGFFDPPSTLISPLATLDPTGLADPLRVQLQQTAPQPGAATGYHLAYTLETGDPVVINNHIPLDAAANFAIALSKQADRREAAIGELVRYTVRVENTGAADIAALTLSDLLPPGFSLLEESLKLDGQAAGFTVQSLRPLVLTGIAVPAGGSVSLAYVLQVGAGVASGPYRNSISGALGGNGIGNTASATVTVVADPDFEQATIVGKVFADTDGDGWQDLGEPGLAGVRLATVTGLLIETEAFGRFHIAAEDVDNLARGRNFYLKVDAESLPEGSGFTTENPRVKRITQGSLNRFDFGIAVPGQDAHESALRAAVDLGGVLFEPGLTAMTPLGNRALDGIATRLAAFDCGTVTVMGLAGTCPVTMQGPVEYDVTTRFAQLSDVLSDSDRAALDNIADAWDDREVVRISVTGHASSEPIRPQNQALFADNYVLSEARAQSVARYMAEALGVASNRIEVIGRGPDDPVASNATEAGRSLNRRAEIRIYAGGRVSCSVLGYDAATLAAARTRAVVDRLADSLTGTGICSVVPAGLAAPASHDCGDCGGFVVTAASRAFADRADDDPTARTALVTADLTAPGAGPGRVWVREDPALLERRLAVTSPSVVRLAGGRLAAAVTFATHTNYAAFIERMEIVLYARGDTDRVRPLARLPVPTTPFARIQWASDDPFEPGLELVAILRAYGPAGSRDETAPIGLKLVGEDFTGRIETVDDSIAALYDRPAPRQQTILIDGSRVRVHGEDIPADASVTIDGQPIPVDRDGRFAAEYLVPIGEREFNVTVTDGVARTEHRLPVDVDGRYRFVAALADFTASRTDFDGAIEPLSGDPEFADDSLVEGRLALYLKGKIKGRYLMTAQIDTGEEDVGELIERLDEKDPRTLFRYLDPDRYYPVYGDDSTAIDDTDSLGKFYVRVDWDRSKALWGNYHTGITGTEFAQYNRSLYGAKLDYGSRAINAAQNETRGSGILFASEAESALAHDEFRGTGGSLYYLRNADIVLGSEKVHIEVRERDSGRVLENVALVRGVDYEIDALQGRVLLAKPLNQHAFATAPAIVRDEPLDGDDTLLLVDYEYIPSGFGRNNMTTGGRGRYWVGDHVQIGATLVDESRDAGDYELSGVDVTLKAGEGTYLKLESAHTEASQTNVFFSDNGGLSFASTNRLDPATNGELAGPREGDAVSVEGRVNLAERGLTERDWTGAFWWRRTDAGFSVARRDLGVETEETGFEIVGEVAQGLELSARASSVETVNQLESGRFSLQLEQSQGRGRLGGELRVVDETNLAAGTSVDATLAALRYTHTVRTGLDLYAVAQQTVDDDDGAYADNDLLMIGAQARVADRTSVRAEHSEGDRGEATLLSIDHQITPDRQVYGAYTLSADRTDALPYREQFAIGQRSAIGDQTTMFNETQFVDDDALSGIAHVFGLDFDIGETWAFGVSAQQGELTALSGLVDRNALGLSGSFEGDKWRWRSSVESRTDFGSEQRHQIVSSHRVDRQFSDAFRVLLRLNVADTNDDVDPTRGARFVEGSLGIAYRPIANDRLNYLAKYTVLYDLPSLAQQRSDAAQRSEILAFEAVYRINEKWDLGGKLARRHAEVRENRMDGAWYDSDADLLIVRGTYHLLKSWDALVEYRSLDVSQNDGRRTGFLFGIDRHINDHMKIGVGYNATDFSDDLSVLDYDRKGWFLNVVGKY